MKVPTALKDYRNFFWSNQNSFSGNEMTCGRLSEVFAPCVFSTLFDDTYISDAKLILAYSSYYIH